MLRLPSYQFFHQVLESWDEHFVLRVLTKESVAEEIIKLADSTIDSGIKCPVEFHGEGAGVLPVSPHASNDHFELTYVVLDELSTILDRIEDLLGERERERE